MKDKLLEESLKLDKIIKDKSGIDKDPAIIFAYANINPFPLYLKGMPLTTMDLLIVEPSSCI